MNRIRRVKRLNRDIFVTKTYKWMATGLLLLITIPIVLAVPAIEIKFKNMRTIDDLYPDYKIADVINDDLIVTIPTEYEEKSVNNKKIRVNKNLKEEKIKYSDINIGTGYGIHGTNDEWSIDKNASMGCIRLLNDDIKELYEMVPTGIPVWIGHTETLEKWGLYKVSK